MPTVLEARMDGSNVVRYFHIPIVNFYLNCALSYATESQEAAEGDIPLRRAICAISFSAMTLEAFINERSEDDIPSSEKADFDRMQRKYKKEPGKSAVLHKYVKLLELKYQAQPSPDLVTQIEELVSVRNMLVHYQPADTAAKYILPPARKAQTSDGGTMVSISLIEKPLRVEPPFLNKVNAATAAASYNAVLAAMKYWYQLDNVECGLEKYPVFAPN